MDLNKNTHRLYLSLFFFLSGVCFSTWTSRIPTIKDVFDLNKAELGTILLFMPISSLAGLPVSGWLVSRFDSRIPMTIGFSVMSIAMIFIGIADSKFGLVAALCVFAFSMRIFNISVNTQAITLQKQFDRQINGSFHGLWSTGGIVGVGFSTILVALKVSLLVHFAIVPFLAISVTAISYNHLLKNDKAPSGNKLKLGKPDPYIVYLGMLVFLAAICEGGMFDWSGLFFKEVLNQEVFTVGYFTFMVLMAISRFASDRIIHAIGMPRTYIMSGVLIFCGILLAVIVPSFWLTMLGFCLVGLGTGCVIPMTYLLAGGSKKYSPGLAISVVATYGIAGMLVGPSMIGYIAHAFGLQVAFVAFAIAGILLVPISGMFFRHQKTLS
jgi:MFS family permease